MKIYLASFFDTRARLLPIRRQLESMGHTCTSTWLNEIEQAKPNADTLEKLVLDHKYLLHCAKRDINDILDSNMLILDTNDINESGGREVAYGFAYSQCLNLIVVGPERNVFHKLADFHFNNWDECLTYLRKITLPF